MPILIDFYITVAFPLALAAVQLLWVRARSKDPMIDGDWVAFAWGWLLFVGVFTILSQTHKLIVAESIWSILSGLCGLAFLFSFIMLGSYAKEKKWISVLVCVAMLVFTVASGEHFSHQWMNAHRALSTRGIETNALRPDDN